MIVRVLKFVVVFHLRASRDCQGLDKFLLNSFDLLPPGKGLCNVSTTSHHNPDAVLNELTRALMFKVPTLSTISIRFSCYLISPSLPFHHSLGHRLPAEGLHPPRQDHRPQRHRQAQLRARGELLRILFNPRKRFVSLEICFQP